jgi:hypothetical protein
MVLGSRISETVRDTNTFEDDYEPRNNLIKMGPCLRREMQTNMQRVNSKGRICLRDLYEYGIITDLKEMVYGKVGWIHLDQDNIVR